MTKALAGLFISLGLLAPALASAHSAPRPHRDTTPPSVTTVHIASSNVNPSVAVPGDTVSISFTTSEKVQTPIVLVNSKPLVMRAANSSGNTWVASYKVVSKDPWGKAQYVIALADMAGNPYACSSIKTPFQILIKYCPPTDGSSVTIAKDAPAPADTQAPVIAAHADVYATTSATQAAVSYALPTATDNVDASVAVSCTPASGSVFSLGTTTVICSAEDAAGNSAQSAFAVVVVQEGVEPPAPSPYTMASQPDESFLCGQTYRTWRYCDEAASFSFTDTPTSTKATIDLGRGSSLGTGILQSVTIAKDAQTSLEAENNFWYPWLITIECFTDSAHTSVCPDWAAVSDNANDSTDGKYWSADFSSLNRTFNPAYYYQMTIDDTGRQAAVFGSESLQEPYWVVTGLH